MKWQIAPEFRDEYRKKQAKRSGGSAPSSPASSKEVNPNFRGPNGQNLGYDTTMVSSFSAKDGALPPPGRITFQPQVNYPPVMPPGPTFAPPSQTQESQTPQRRRTDTGNTLPDSHAFDDSPLPHRHAPHPNGHQMYTLPTAAGSSQQSPPNPNHNHNQTLSSSYIDTPFHQSQHSIITPAPIRQNPRLAPPSTLVAPSKFMPESSPAGPGLFWKGILGQTPGQAIPDISPVKTENHNRKTLNGMDRQVMSSSPPPMDGLGSPSKQGPGRSSQPRTAAGGKRDGSNEDVEMRSRAVSEVGTARPDHMAVNKMHVKFNQAVGVSTGGSGRPGDDDDDDDEGYDLAKGFAPIAGMRRPGSVNAR